MTHFGIICPPATGHLNPLTALGRELQNRGHRVTVVNVLDAEKKANSAGLGFSAIAESEFPRGTMTRLQMINPVLRHELRGQVAERRSSYQA